VRFEPLPGREAEFRDHLLHVIEPTRTEPGCVAMRVFESMREPRHFAIHSEWQNEGAFEHHAQLPHTLRFVEAAKGLLTHPIEGFRSREIDIVR